MNTNNCDIAIIGGGLVGLCAALVLRHAGRRITLIEAGDLDAPQPGGLNARSIALAISSVQFFRALGLWSRIERQAAPIRNIHISSRGHWGVTRLDARDCDLDALGYVIEHDALCRCLLEAVKGQPDIRLEQRAVFESLADPDHPAIDYRRDDRAHRLEAGLALVADGARSSAREALGIEREVVDYGQSALICNVEVSRPRADTAYERFTADGPLAMLPLGGARYACVWTMGADDGETLGALERDRFLDRLQACFGYRLGLLEDVGERFALPIRRSRAGALRCGRCLLLGNAANALHPVAGQGFNLALRDIACLHELLGDRDPRGLDAAGFAALGVEYESLRRREQGRVIRYGDGLVTLFSNDLPLLAPLRAAALGLLDLLPALKKQAALAGMGMSFGGNRLLRGRL